MHDVVPMTIKRAWVRVISLDTSGASTLLQSRLNSSKVPCAPVHGELEVLQAAVSAANDDRHALHAFALGAQPNNGPLWASGAASVLCRLSHWQRGDLQRFHATRRRASHGGDLSVMAFDRALDAAVELQQLRLAVATKLARESIELAGRVRRRCPAHRFGEVLLARVMYEYGELSQAEELLRDHFHTIRSYACADAAIGFYTLIARIAVDQQKGDLAMFLLREGVALGEARGWQRLIAACWQESIDLLVRTGRIEEARDCVRVLESRWSSGSQPHDPDLSTAVANMRCCVRIASGEAAQAIAELRRLHSLATERGDTYAAVRLEIRLSEALDVCGQEKDALDALACALEAGCRAGMHQSFVSAGPGVSRLLTRFQQLSGTELQHYAFLQPYVCSLMRSATQADATRCARGIKLRGPLSGREHDILKLMRHGSSNKLIARHLGIAPETVKSHAKRIFVKLGAQTRVEAVTKAASLSLI